MPTVSRLRLLALSDATFKRNAHSPTPKPAKSKFRPIRLNVNKYSTDWDRKRGAAARLMAVLLQEDDTGLAARVCETPSSSRTYGGAADWLAGEARYLRKVATMMDTTAGRLKVVLDRCGAVGQSDPQQSDGVPQTN